VQLPSFQRCTVRPLQPLGTPGALPRGVQLHLTWIMIGATIAVVLGASCGLYELGDAGGWIAAVIGGALGAIAYGGPVECSLLQGKRRPGALSLAGSRSVHRQAPRSE
jgi:hypothetical protein